MNARLLCGDVIETLRTLDAGSVHCVITSPPYFGLRSYIPDGHADKLKEIGLEATPAEFVARLVEVFREVRRVLRDDGTCWINLGDSFGSGEVGRHDNGRMEKDQHRWSQPMADQEPRSKRRTGQRAGGKQLLGIPWRTAFALQDDGWILRSDIIWCLSGGTRVYARTQKGEMPMTIKDMMRLDPSTVKLWNGQKWTQVLGWSRSDRPAEPIEIILRSGERIGCTPGHLWPTQRGNVRAAELEIGDVIRTCQLPEPAQPRCPAALDDEMVGWFVGLYLAEGSRSDGTIQIAGHVDELARLERLEKTAAAFDGYCSIHQTSVNGCTIHLNSPILNGIIDAYIGGRVAKDKHLKVACWKRSNVFLRAVLDGYLSGDGSHDKSNDRWRLGFCRNYALESDLRTLCARLGISLRLNLSMVDFQGRKFPSFRGEIRFNRSTHHNNKQDGEIVAIGRSKARQFWDIGVEDEPHLFALASGVLTHNSKSNPMPESVRDRPTKSHEHLFLFAKQPRYFYDAIAISEPAEREGTIPKGGRAASNAADNRVAFYRPANGLKPVAARRNKRDVWRIASAPLKMAHFATFPIALVEPCILAGTSERGACSVCGAPWRRVVERKFYGDAREGLRDEDQITGKHKWRGTKDCEGGWEPPVTTGWQPTCTHDASVIPCTVLDPFSGAATTGKAALKHRRRYIGIDLSEKYTAMAKRRLSQVQVELF